jgi:hypothetical protein
MPTQISMENRCWCLDATVLCELPPIQTWVLWKFTIPSLVNHASSVNRMLVTHCVYNAFCEKRLAKRHPCTTIRRSEGSHLLDVVRVKWLFMENYPDKGNTNTFSSCNSSHTSSGIFRASQYANFSKTSQHFITHWLLDTYRLGFFCSLEYYIPLRPVTSCIHSQVPGTWDYRIWRVV